MDRGNGSVLKAGWSPAWVAIVLAIALAGLPAAAVVHPAAQDGGTALAFPSTVRSSAPSVLGASGSRGLVPSEASPVPGVGWEALSHASNGLSPPDVQVAVGPDHIVEAVNSALGIYTKLGRPSRTPTCRRCSPPVRTWSGIRGSCTTPSRAAGSRARATSPAGRSSLPSRRLE